MLTQFATIFTALSLLAVHSEAFLHTPLSLQTVDGLGKYPNESFSVMVPSGDRSQGYYGYPFSVLVVARLHQAHLLAMSLTMLLVKQTMR